MNQLYKGQTNVQLLLDTTVDLTGTTSHKILAKKQDGTLVEWAATPVGTTLTYELQANDTEQLGRLSIQAYFELAGRKSFGKIVNITILEPNKI
jgi:hypothetical protein